MSATVPGTTLPILEVDEAHWQKIHADAAVAQEYSLKARNGFQLSTGSFKFPVPEDASFSEPNIIQIVLGKTHSTQPPMKKTLLSTPSIKPTSYPCTAQSLLKVLPRVQIASSPSGISLRPTRKIPSQNFR
jgi:hypothetical protein